MQEKFVFFKKFPQIKISLKTLFFFLFGAGLGLFFLLSSFYFLFEKKYQNRVFPGVKIEGEDFSGKTLPQIEEYFGQKNSQLGEGKFIFVFGEKVATLSGEEFNWGYAGKSLANLAYLYGRSGHFFSDLYQQGIAFWQGFNFPPSYAFNDQKLTTFLESLAQEIDIPPQEALFNFQNGRVVAFRLSQNGRALDIGETKKMVSTLTPLLVEKNQAQVQINLPVKIVEPKVESSEINKFGIKELVGRGSSRFWGSISNRIHNIQLAASRLNGILLAPGEEFSFNQALGDVSKFTGYKEAYIIKDGRTVLGDGGGVCQVSTTFFRTLLAAGLPILERHAHSYRVSYYEQDSPVGLDASVYAPSWDLKFKNDLPSHLLIQAYVDAFQMTLVFEFYGTGDGRKVTISQPVIKNQVPPPPDLYQDDPTLPKGKIKQIDWKAWGAEVSFSRTVTRGGQVLISETFNSSYQPWQAVFLRGTRE